MTNCLIVDKRTTYRTGYSRGRNCVARKKSRQIEPRLISREKTHQGMGIAAAKRPSPTLSSQTPKALT